MSQNENPETVETAAPTVGGEAAAEAAAAKPVVEKDSKNGVTRPKAGTKTGRIFEIADELSRAASAPAKRKDVLEAAKKEDINPATAATQYGRWRKYNGLKASEAVVAEATPAAAAENSDVVVEGGEDAAPVVEGAGEAAE